MIRTLSGSENMGRIAHRLCRYVSMTLEGLGRSAHGGRKRQGVLDKVSSGNSGGRWREFR